MTYRELSSAAAQIASELRRLGARPGRLVGVVMEKGWEQAVAVLAILRAGAAYLPVDPSLPLERRQFLLEHGDVEIVLTQLHLVEDLEWPQGMSLPPGWGMVGSGGRLGGGFCDTGTAPLLTSPHSQPPPPRGEEPDLPRGSPLPGDGSAMGEGLGVRGSHLAYVLFTSGSTGVPKGVMIEHRAVANTVADVNRRFGISAADRVLALSALSFDLSVWDLFGILGAGGRVVLPEPEASRDPDHWHQRILGEGVTVWNSVPALMELYVEYLEGHGQPMPESLRLVLLSGDWIPLGLPDRIRSLSRREEPVSLVSLGGATEASIWSIFYPIEAVSPEWKSIPYGRPMANQTFQVLNERLDPCPDWVPGQLHIGGVGLARGYWKDQEKTRASFFVHPRSGERLYRTGDLGRWLPDGQIELLGREDLQVKIQGYRVELGEIEAALSRHPAVREAVVAAVGESKGHKRLVAYCVPAGDPFVEPAELRVWLEERLPEYMVPHLYVPLAELPLTPNGKIDRKALPAPEPAKASREQGFRAPRTPTERRMASLWEAILETEPVGLADELFELGGDSMLALRLLAEIEKDLGCRLPLAAFFQEATVERLAALVDASRR
ncbi:MAG TPA: amino acid adenylation domain-containing protein [Thermoanaerobaculia bacterium]|nr:amino acid adenylation domain-containing protein [Thermoanaerobaculia bacterium]